MWYISEGKRREKLFEYIHCNRTTGDELCNSIFKISEKSSFNTKDWRSQTMDKATNTSGRNKGCVVFLQEKAPLAVYNSCANHDLNLVLCKCSKKPEIHVMLDSLKQLGIFFKYSPKRCRQFEDCVEQHNATLPQNKNIIKKRFKMFCETRWVEKSLVLEDFQKMHEPLLQCFESITLTGGWDGNSVIQASGLLKSIRNSTFIASFHTIKYFSGFIHRLSLTLQGSECDILRAFQIIDSVKQVLQNVRSNICETFPSV